MNLPPVINIEILAVFFLHLLIEKITISIDGIRMELKTSGLGSLIGELMKTENMEAV